MVGDVQVNDLKAVMDVCHHVLFRSIVANK